MKSPLIRLLALGIGVAIVVSCDASPISAPLKSGSSSSSSSSSGSSGSSSADKVAPTVSIDTPTVGSLYNVGDSVLVVLHLTDNKGVASVTVGGYTESGSVDLGTFQRTIRYTPVTVPATGTFHAGLKDTTVRRYLHPASAADTALDSLIVLADVVDSTGNPDSARTRVDLVVGPALNFVAPTNGDSVPAGVGMTVQLHGTDAQGVSKMSLHVTGETNWPTKLDTTIASSFAPNSRDVLVSGVIRVPTDAPVRGRITVTGTATNVNGQPGNASPLAVIVRSGSNAEPLVTHTVLSRSEITDSITVNAKGDGIAMVGFVVLDSVGNQIKRDSVALPTPYASNVSQRMALALPTTTQGTKTFAYGFAIDQSGRTGYSVKSGIGTPQGLESAAYTDSMRIAYGETYALPAGRSGVVGDIAVDRNYGNVFLSNTTHNLLEVWNNQSQSFAANGVAVGSQPWGMDLSTTPGVLLVANSGGTDISQVSINNSDPSQIKENLASRILTRNTVVYTLTQTETFNVDSAGDTTVTWHSSFTGPFQYSDRPQYVEQGANGLIYYSTEPTTTASPGTIRVIDPKQAVADPRQIWQYGTRAADGTQIAMFNLDYMDVIKAPAGSENVSDLIYACDHTPGTANATTCITDSTATGVAAQLVAKVNSDISEVQALDVTSLALTDTTFAARSGDRNYIGFGEGNTVSRAGRIIMAKDAATFDSLSVSGTIKIQDALNNASEVVTAMAMDSTGQLVGAHGTQGGYLLTVPTPLDLRLRGSYATTGGGSGIAFDPGSNGYLVDGTDQVMFIASASGRIDIVDVAHYNNRGTLQTKYPLYGPLRATRPLPGDPADVVMKLYGMSTNGLVVINLRAGDIKPPSP